MSDQRDKNPAFLMNPIRNENKRRRSRIEEHNTRRRERRSNVYLENRNILTPSTSGQTGRPGNGPTNKNANVTKKSDSVLHEWRNKRQKINTTKIEKKPPFRVGVVRHKINSPIFLHSSAPPVKFKATLGKGKTKLINENTRTSNNTPSTRRTAARLLRSKSIATKSKTTDQITQSSTTKDSCSTSNGTGMQYYEASTSSTAGIETRSTSTDYHVETQLGSPLKEIATDGNIARVDEQNAGNKTTQDSVLEDSKQTAETEISQALIFSPFIVSSRGKENIRMEQQSRLGIKSTCADEIPTKETVMQMLNISVQEEEMTAQYFRHILDKEVKRLENLCEVWLQQKSDDSTPEEAKLLINQAVGQTNLLMGKKFERFRGLVSDCEQGKGQMLVSCRDLQGFWDMMHLDIDNCNARFKQLDDLKDNGWQDNNVELPTNKVQSKKKIPKGRKKVVPKKESSLRETIRALRQKKQDLGKNEEFRSAASLQATNEAMLLAHGETVNFPTKNVIHGKNVNRQSLSRAVRLSEGAKTEVQTVALRAMRVSQLFKPLQVETDESITYVNSTLTPGKSILKQADSDSTLKTTKVQHFDTSVDLEDVRKILEFSNDSDDENDETLKNCTRDSKSFESTNNSTRNDTVVESSLSDSNETHRRSPRSIQHNSPVVKSVRSMSTRIEHDNFINDGTLKNRTQDSKSFGSKNNSTTNETLVESSLSDSNASRRRSPRSIQYDSPVVKLVKSMSTRIKPENSVNDETLKNRTQNSKSFGSKNNSTTNETLVESSLSDSNASRRRSPRSIQYDSPVVKLVKSMSTRIKPENSVNDETLKNRTQNSKSFGPKKNSTKNDSLAEPSLSDNNDAHRRTPRSIQHDSPVVELMESMSTRIKHEKPAKDIDELSSITPMKRKERQSSRKSMKFKEEYCFACTPSKPRTPGIELSSQKLKKSDLLEDKFESSSSKKKQVAGSLLTRSAGSRRSSRLAQKMQTPNTLKH